MSLVWVIYLIDVICQPWVGVGILTFVGTLVCAGLTVGSCFTTDKQALCSDDEAFRLFLRKPVWKKLMIFGISILFLSNFIRVGA
jgi:hypothetical protein